MAGVFVWLKVRARIQDPAYHAFSLHFLSFALYNLFLSGLIREWFPYWGSLLEFPTSIIASSTCFILFSIFAEIKMRVVGKFTLVYFLSFVFSVICNCFGFEEYQFYLYLIARVLILYPLAYHGI